MKTKKLTSIWLCLALVFLSVSCIKHATPSTDGSDKNGGNGGGNITPPPVVKTDLEKDIEGVVLVSNDVLQASVRLYTTGGVDQIIDAKTQEAFDQGFPAVAFGASTIKYYYPMVADKSKYSDPIFKFYTKDGNYIEKAESTVFQDTLFTCFNMKKPQFITGDKIQVVLFFSDENGVPSYTFFPSVTIMSEPATTPVR